MCDCCVMVCREGVVGRYVVYVRNFLWLWR